MKKIIFALSAVVLVVAFSPQANGINPVFSDSPAFAWTELAFDFGKIKANVPVTHEFTFVNKGTSPLVISSVQASCGCTVTEFSKQPIPIGQRGFVKATYNAENVGTFTKTVTVHANTQESTIQLTIKGEVIRN